MSIHTFPSIWEILMILGAILGGVIISYSIAISADREKLVKMNSMVASSWALSYILMLLILVYVVNLHNWTDGGDFLIRLAICFSLWKVVYNCFLFFFLRMKTRDTLARNVSLITLTVFVTIGLMIMSTANVTLFACYVALIILLQLTLLFK